MAASYVDNVAAPYRAWLIYLFVVRIIHIYKQTWSKYNIRHVPMLSYSIQPYRQHIQKWYSQFFVRNPPWRINFIQSIKGSFNPCSFFSSQTISFDNLRRNLLFSASKNCVNDKSKKISCGGESSINLRWPSTWNWWIWSISNFGWSNRWFCFCLWLVCVDEFCVQCRWYWSQVKTCFVNSRL